MSHYTEQVALLQAEASKLPFGPTQVSLLEEAVRIADLHNDIQRGYDARLALTRAALFSGRADLLLVAFTWMVATYDRDPSQFDERSFLWRYKWVAGSLVNFPEMSRVKIEQMFEDLERRCRQAGYGEHAVATSRRDFYVDVRDVPAAQHANIAYQRSQRDQLSDCEACVVGMDGEYHYLQQQWPEQIAAIQPLLAGRLACATQPLNSVSRALVPLLRLGRFEEARDLQLRYVRHLRLNAHHMKHLANQVTFMSLAAQHKIGWKFLNRNLHEAFDAVIPIDRLRFFRAALVNLHCHLARGDDEPVELASHPMLPPATDHGRFAIEPLCAWMLAEALQIAAAYDQRNGNDYETRETLGCQALVAELSIP